MMVGSMVVCSCVENNTSKSATPAFQPFAASDTLNGNNKPLFDDPNGELDSLYRASGCVFDADLQRAVENGDINATKMLVTMYAYGIGGVNADRRKAYLLYRNLAEQGDADAQAHLGYMILYGLGPVQDNEQGLTWLEKSANQRCPTAFYYLGHYFQQTGEKENAKTCFQNAVALGMPQAKDNLDNLN